MKAYCPAFLFSGLFLLSSFAFQSCDNQKDIDLSAIQKETELKRFERAFLTMDTANFSENLAQLEENYPPFFSAKTEEIFWRNQRKDELQLKLFKQTEKLFGNMEKEEEELNRIFKRYYYYFGQQNTFEVYTYISRLDYDYPVIAAPPYCFIALDMYLGANNDYYAALPNYLQFKRQPQFLLRDVAYALSENTLGNPTDDNKLIEAMIYHGKLLYVTKQLCPFLREDELLVYPSEKMKFCEEHERDMWVYFIENGVLFKSGEELQRRFIDVAPFSKFRTSTDPLTPGGVGRWFGYKIVSAYMEENPELSLKQLIQEKDAAKILKLSGYKP